MVSQNIGNTELGSWRESNSSSGVRIPDQGSVNKLLRGKVVTPHN